LGIFPAPAALVVKSERRAPARARSWHGVEESLLCGEPVKKLTAFVLFIILGLALFVPAVSYADNNSAQRKSQKSAQKAYKKSLKQQKKSQKKARKSQMKAQKQWKKQHGS
jgi:hypothetical protein